MVNVAIKAEQQTCRQMKLINSETLSQIERLGQGGPQSASRSSVEPTSSEPSESALLLTVFINLEE